MDETPRTLISYVYYDDLFYLSTSTYCITLSLSSHPLQYRNAPHAKRDISDVLNKYRLNYKLENFGV